MSLLSMKNIEKSFFGKKALNNVSLDVDKGEIHALLGENGAGKTTLMNILYGIYTKDSGEIMWKGEPIEFHSPKDAINCRIGMVHQHFTLVPTLTVSENITLGLKLKGYPFPERKAINEKIREISTKYGLIIDPEAYVSTLSVGEQQRVEIMKLLYRDAELLILDEPTAVLTPQEIKTFYDVLRKLRDDGHSVIIITHKIAEIMDITDRSTVLRDGNKVVDVTTRDMTEEQLSEYMIGRQLNPVRRCKNNCECSEGLFLNNISFIRNGITKLNSITANVAPGEILGIAGVDGNGQKELAEVILGITRHSSGSIGFCGQDISNLNILKRKELGIGYISDDRHHDGLIMDMNLKENMLLKTHTEQKFIKRGFINNKLVLEDTQRAVRDYKIKTPGVDTPIRYLSGGNQQKLILARELAGEPRAVVAFQPTRGLDIGASEFIQEKLLECSKNGACIVLISADLEEVLALSDRIAVLYEGKFMGILENNEDLEIAQIGLMMAGSLEKQKGE